MGTSGTKDMGVGAKAIAQAAPPAPPRSPTGFDATKITVFGSIAAIADRVARTTVEASDLHLCQVSSEISKTCDKRRFSRPEPEGKVVCLRDDNAK